MNNLKKRISFFLSLLLILNSLAYARPSVEIENDDIAILIKTEGGKSYCQTGCGTNTDHNGNGYGHGSGSGKGRGGDVGSGKIPSIGRNESGSERGTPSHEGTDGESIYARWDHSNQKKSDSDAWTDYKEQVKSLNNQWTAELNDSYAADKQNFDKNTQIVENWSQSPLGEVVFIRSPMHDIDTQIKQSLPQELAGYQYLNYNRDDFKYYQDYQFKSSYKDELNTIRDSHSEFIPHSPQSYNAYKAGLMTLVDSDKNYVNGEINLGHINKEAAKRLLELAIDIGTDLMPLTGIAKDLYRGLVGKDPMTGQDLTTLERSLGVAFGTLGIVTLGASSFLTIGAKEIAALAKSTYKEARLSEEIAKAVNAATTNVHVMKYGTSGKFTIMGQGMDRVHEVSEALKKENIIVETFEATSEAKREWNLTRIDFPNEVPENIARNTPIFIEDEIWVKNQISNGNTILGLEEIDRYSTFWNMEKIEVWKHLKDIK